jgi:hypothetical protein
MSKELKDKVKEPRQDEKRDKEYKLNAVWKLFWNPEHPNPMSACNRELGPSSYVWFPGLVGTL